MTCRRLVVAGLPLLLASCHLSDILPKPPPPPALYHLTPLAQAATAPAIDAALAVELPRAPDSLDTARIALTRGAYGFDYFADAAWTDPAPALVQALIIESLESRVRVVASAAAGVRADAVLASTLRQFEAVYADGSGAPTVEMRLDCLLLRGTDRLVLAVRSFSGSAAAAANDIGAIVAAFDAALHAALGDLPAWIVASLGARR